MKTNKKRFYSCLIIGLLCLFIFHAQVLTEEKAKKPSGAVTVKEWKVLQANNNLTMDLYKKLVKEKKGENIFFSPTSITTCLAMTYAGAKGETANQMAKTLHYTVNQEKLHLGFKELLKKINGPKGDTKRSYELSIANALWGQKGYKWLQPFLKTTKENYGAGLHEVDFAGATEKARKTINDWVEKKTNNKIKNLIQKGVLDELTRLVLTNAIYFKGTWREKFKKKWTRDLPFTLASGKKVTVPMMSQTTHFMYAENKDAQFLEMDYKETELAMVVILPKKTGGLADIEKSLTINNFMSLIGKRKAERVWVKIPRFKMTSEFSLKDTLKALGMKDAFIFGKADFSGMNGVTSGDERLYISEVIHKAFVDVNETGTEAAAATAVVMKVGAAPQKPKEFNADHPFIFMIRDKRTGTILFMGRVLNPK
jgi:serpin B